jgi:thiol-disulfide isomerase/thioredoxin
MSLFQRTHMPSLDGATGWLNSEPLGPAELRGRVVLVDFWTYTCINWLRTLPYVRAWAEKYRDDGLVVVGVHTPEFEFERDVDNVRRAVEQMDIGYPVALDPDYAVWQAFANHYWPALYFVDRDGVIRDHHFGEGRYEESERVVQDLLGVDGELVSVEGQGIEAPADWDELASPETYLGDDRGERSVPPGEELGLNRWSLTGGWTTGEQAAVLNETGGTISYRFLARDLHLVLRPPAGGAARFQVRIDGEPPGRSHGLDVDAQGNGTVVEPRLYQLVRQDEGVEAHTCEITFLDPGVAAYVFTFG